MFMTDSTINQAKMFSETISQLDDIFIVSGYEKSINISNNLSKRKQAKFIKSTLQKNIIDIR